MNENSATVENGNGPTRIARIQARRERAQRNREWLDAHLAELLPQAYGKLVAVAGWEAFIAETEEEARSWARTAHPEDEGLVIRYIPPEHVMSLNEPLATLEIMTDPEEIAQSRARHEQFKRNVDWLQSHWSDLLPQALGKHLVVAGQEAFVADTSEEAWAMAEAAHPDDEGFFCQYVLPHRGPRIYANRW